MKLHKIILSLWLINSFTFASSEVAKKVCPCGPIEHIFGKIITKRYAEQNLNSKLRISDDNEDVPANIVAAVTAFGLHVQLTDKDGNPIIPQPILNAEDMVLPMYKSDDFQLRKSIIATTAMNDVSTTSEILEKWNNQYNQTKKLMQKYTITSSSIAQDGIIICAPCSTKKNK